MSYRPEEHVPEPVHEIIDHGGIQWEGYDHRRGSVSVFCACGGPDAYPVDIEFTSDRDGAVTIHAGPSCMDFLNLKEWVETRIEGEAEAKEEADIRMHYERGPAISHPPHPYPYGRHIR